MGKLKIGKSITDKMTAGEAKSFLKDRYQGEAYIKLVKEKKVSAVTQTDIDECIAEAYKEDKGAAKLGDDSGTAKPTPSKA